MLVVPCSLLLVLLASAYSSSAHHHQPAAQHPFAQTALFDSEPKHIAVIGAGAAGTSFAYFLRQTVPSTQAQITILEATDRVGGRATAIDFEGASIEIGASIFLKENQHLYNASKLFNLTLVESATDPEPGGASDDRWGIWSPLSRRFHFVSSTSSKLTLAKMIWRYGIRAPYKVTRLARQAASAFGRGAYSSSAPATTTPPRPPTLAALIANFGLTPYANRFGREYLGVNDLYLDEIVAAATRVNYGQDLHAHLPALPALISMAAATGEATAVKNGNQQIMENFAIHAEASLYFQKRVTEIEKLNTTSKPYRVLTADGATTYFDAVAIAVPNPPFKLTNVAKQAAVHRYVRLHVTLVAATALNPSYFGKNPPSRILTSMSHTTTTITTTPPPPPPPPAPAPAYDDEHHRFNSISHLGNGTYKIFSPAEVTPAQLAQWFDPPPVRAARFKWDAYPVFGTTTTTTDAARVPVVAQDQPVMLDDHIFYLNAFEHVFSTMESQTAVAKRVAEYVADWILSES
ncbi:hypothetical protein HDU86_000654 [Geranomyces michiganensis]|nr:hypothetical protein HDU86_000654 [Geranomyces michiganensis]